MFDTLLRRRHVVVTGALAATALVALGASTLVTEPASAHAVPSATASVPTPRVAGPTGPASGQSTAAIDAPRLLTFELRNSGGRFLADSFTGFGTQLTLQSPGKEHFGVGYRWEVVQTATHPMLRNFDVPGCMDVGDGNGRTAAGVPITANACDGSSSQRWIIVSNPLNPSFVTIQNEFSKKFVTKLGPGIGDGTKFIQDFGFGDNPLFSQQFAMTDTE